MASATLENSMLMVMASIMLARGIVTSPMSAAPVAVTVLYLMGGIVTLATPISAPPFSYMR